MGEPCRWCRICVVYLRADSTNAVTSILDQYGNGAYLDGASRRPNSIQYISPNMSGFVGRIGLSASGGATTEGTQVATAGAPGNYSDGREWFLQGTYANGPIYATLAYRNVTAEGRPAAGLDDRQLRFAGYYILPMGLKLGLQLDRATRAAVSGNVAGTTSTSVSRTAWEIPISYQLGQGDIMFSYTRAGDNGILVNSGAKLITLGYDYALSKRTNIGVWVSKLSNDNNGAYQPFLDGASNFTGSGLLAGESATTWALGVKHVF
ncbi:MAG: porin [Burkholderiales bacterium]